MIRIFKRASDGKVLTSELQGNGSWPNTEDQDFEFLFGSAEPYASVTVASIPEDTKTIDILPNGTAKFTPVSQAEKDARPEKIKRDRYASGKAKLIAGQPLTQDEVDALFP